MEDLYSEDSDFGYSTANNNKNKNMDYLNFNNKVQVGPPKLLHGNDIDNDAYDDFDHDNDNDNNDNAVFRPQKKQTYPKFGMKPKLADLHARFDTPKLPIVVNKINHGPNPNQSKGNVPRAPGSRALLAFNNTTTNTNSAGNQGKKNFLTGFLNKYRTGDDGVFTHTSLGTPLGSFNIPNSELPTLWDVINKNLEASIPTYLTEKPQNPCAIKVDLDFRFDYEEANRLYTWDHIAGTINLYNEAIRHYMDVDPNHFCCMVFERNEPYRQDGNLKDGVHLIYPDIICDTTIQHMIRNRVLENIHVVFSSLTLKNSYEDMIDKAVISKNNWLMYGCQKPGRDPYSLSRVVDSTMTEVDVSHYTNRHLIELLSLYRKSSHLYTIREELQKDFDEEIERQNSKQKKSKDRTVALNKKFVLTTRRRRPKLTDQNLETVKILVGLLQQYRAEITGRWLEVGYCLHNIDQGLLDVWIEFSKRSDRFKEGECEQLWGTFKDEGLGMGSLHRWAKLDNPQNYKETQRLRIGSYILKSITGTTYDVARVVYEMFKFQYVCVSIKFNTWYEFKNHRWIEMDSAIGLRKKISNDVLDEYLRLVSHYNECAIHEIDDDKYQYLDKSKALSDVTYKLRDFTFKEKVFKECYTFFYNKEFMTKLDANPYLIGFENGIYDLSKGTFRDGRPEDYVTLSTGNDYKEFNEDDDEVLAIYKFMSEILPLEPVRNYVWTLLSSFLVGKNKDQNFHLWTGIGGNGKSILVSLFERAFGNYCVKLPVTLITQKRGASNAANPELARTRGKRFASMQEPDEKEQINVGIMKELTGGDMIMARQLFKEPIEFRPQFKLVLCCNHLPSVPPDDIGTWRRIKVVEFISRFVKNPNPNNQYEFPRDNTLEDKIVDWKEAFMHILLNYYKKYVEAGSLNEPREVTAATDEYQKMSDVYIEFVEDKLVQTSNKSCILKLEDAYGVFRAWYKSGCDGKLPPRKDFKTALEKKFGQKYGTGSKAGWPGWMYKEEGKDYEQQPSFSVSALTDGTGAAGLPNPPNAYVRPDTIKGSSQVAPIKTKDDLFEEENKKFLEAMAAKIASAAARTSVPNTPNVPTAISANTGTTPTGSASVARRLKPLTPAISKKPMSISIMSPPPVRESVATAPAVATVAAPTGTIIGTSGLEDLVSPNSKRKILKLPPATSTATSATATAAMATAATATAATATATKSATD
jgi:P4 family phage/plasmid primase-like protien